ncbi:MAG: anion permease [Armatimonadota bacterium]|nr:anion permease [Armatimonadota bacterium]MDR7450591.1 anion permease [Armatimonadota bacterium]MDR7466276.1 anion permease [Armatimonadota bacterium]MDR7492997.1 anion permease [Armatimonadota bacterium]MDR7498246.1 anion permease [Armatimonadota bacterium]
MLGLLAGLYLGWGVGANDAANTFGPQVGAGVVGFRAATVLTAVFAFAGAVIEGPKVFPILGSLTPLTLERSVIAALAAGLTVNILTAFGLPISTSHAIVGALAAQGLAAGRGIQTAALAKLSVAIVTAPLAAAVIANLLYRLLARTGARRFGTIIFYPGVVRAAGVVVGCYASYALGANNVGNAMAPFVAVGVVGPGVGAALGGAAIAAGALTFSHRVIMLVGKQITPLGPYSALVASAATAITAHLFTQVGVPVSTSQSIVGAVIGVGLSKGLAGIDRRMVWIIPAGWLISILASALVAAVLAGGSAALR